MKGEGDEESDVRGKRGRDEGRMAREKGRKREHVVFVGFSSHTRSSSHSSLSLLHLLHLAFSQGEASAAMATEWPMRSKSS